MENVPPIHWGLEIAKIAVPSIIALVMPVITYLLLSSRLETFKNQLQIETYKFQTKYSLFHQRQAEAIETLYGHLAKTENALVLARLYFKDITIKERYFNNA